ncbi:bifunctional 4-hydroxy-2-oxoglutarate aldolase/2-dehydro-3-deoxy-phosphogluconate aldolase [Glycomyces buryatensis]|uniref:Bifunctional 4-hydroxy-2-oxoglutarate aldolase/2-dehydro-3-deoxy-phosphogluconate aldolase n=1 Tax=Glycomyces buryatensis TaxID=2570927 RepID=A0A4V4HQE4_9ACTN|nr:bifunctional 4-hydroxy-2-oxoglutarate aldolase/2-dehydro-3-deoxy-phosphogluconate aldolase [Glycomyces buryatensis]THV33536.1 bifunctional 4-hydroxy-2-oxoglutarate aldolase/2-dehydro-3-deoxy-phosphogluconate aldolase [Glycomyces buryatensis]
MNQAEYFDGLFKGQRVMAIWRGLPADETVGLSKAMWKAGIDLVEVPIGQPGQEAALAAAVEAGAEYGHPVGAGTVVSTGHVARAAAAGAAYTIAPGLNAAVLEASHAAGMPHLPGVATASELQRAVELGCKWVKVFPASSLGADWFKAMSGPFPDVRFVATGGIGPDEVDRYLAAGVSAIGMGSALSDPENLKKLLG